MIPVPTTCVSLVTLLLAVSQLAAQTPVPPPHAHSTADSLEVLRPVAERIWPASTPIAHGTRYATNDRLTFVVLDSISRVRGVVLDPPPPPGTKASRSCPWKMTADTAGLNERAGPNGFIVSLQIVELKDSTAIVDFVFSCGAGMAPVSAYAEGELWRLKRVNHQWVIDGKSVFFIT